MNASNKSVVIYGPQGCGKSLNAQRLRRKLGLQEVIELDTNILGDVPHQGALVLTNDQPIANELTRRGMRVLSFKEAMRSCGFDRSPTTT